MTREEKTQLLIGALEVEIGLLKIDIASKLSTKKGSDKVRAWLAELKKIMTSS